MPVVPEMTAAAAGRGSDPTAEALRQSEERLRLATELAEVGFWDVDPVKDVLIWAARVKAMFGIAADSPVSMADFYAGLHPEDRDRVRIAYAAAADPSQRGFYDVEYRTLGRDDGLLRWVAAKGRGIFDDQGVCVRMIGTAIDITARKQAEEDVLAAKHYTESIINGSPFGLYVVDSDFRIAQMNTEARNGAFIHVRPVIGRDFDEVVRILWPEEVAQPILQIFHHTLETGEPYRSKDFVHTRADNAQVEGYEWQLHRTTMPDGRRGVICYYFDATPLRNIQRALDTARDSAEVANRAKDRFLAVLSHELRTPLSPVTMAVAAMEADPELPFRLREDLTLIRRNVDLEARLIDDLLDLSRIAGGKLQLRLERVHLHPIIQHVLHSSERDFAGKRLKVDVRLDATTDRVRGDPARLQQVVWNLVRNAVKFTPSDGWITITTRNRRGDRTSFLLEIKDSGIGIEAGILPRIFDAFEQGDPEHAGGGGHRFGGLGLGLAIARAIVERHGGALTAASDGPGRGAHFTLCLNGLDEPSRGVPTGDARPAEEEKTPVSARILLVEDHLDSAHMLARLLKSGGYAVTTAGAVAQALDLASRNDFDVLVSDIGLPDGTGYELMQKLGNRFKGIALSGYGMEEDIRKSRAAGFAEHMVKPISAAALQKAIERLAGRGKA